MVAMWHVIYVFCLAIISFYDSERKFSMPGYPLPYIHPCVTEIMTATMHCRGSVVHFEIIFNLITDCLILHLLMSLLPKWNDIQFYTQAIGQSNEKSLTSANLLSRKHWTNIAWWFTTIKDFLSPKYTLIFFCQLAMLISHLCYYLVPFITLLTLRPVSENPMLYTVTIKIITLQILFIIIKLYYLYYVR